MNGAREFAKPVGDQCEERVPSTGPWPQTLGCKTGAEGLVFAIGGFTLFGLGESSQLALGVRNWQFDDAV